jgi:hypothetical protein
MLQVCRDQNAGERISRLVQASFACEPRESVVEVVTLMKSQDRSGLRRLIDE